MNNENNKEDINEDINNEINELNKKFKKSLVINWSITAVITFILILNTIALYITLDVFTKKTLELYNLKSSIQIVYDKLNYLTPLAEDFYEVMHYSNLKDIIEYDPNVELFGNLY